MTEIAIPAGDVVGEQVILAAAIVDWEGEGAKLLDVHNADLLSDPTHRAAWAALREMRRRRLQFDWATLQRVAGDADVASYLQRIVEARPDSPIDLAFHVSNAVWDRQVAQVSSGALPALLEALQKRDPRARALAQAVRDALQGGGAGEWFHDGDEVVREQILEVRRRVAGEASYPFGIPGLDRDLETGKRRLLVGAAPGLLTVVTGLSGSGKSTFTAHLALGLARLGRRVLYGAWEMSGGTTLELLACLSLGWSRSKLSEGSREVADGPDGETRLVPLFDHEEIVQLEERMHAITKSVRFMRNPFRRGRSLATKGRDWTANERNLDTVHEHLADSGCDVFIADLWKRCLKIDGPSEEEDALIRQQSMCEELGVHGILVQQQLLKGDSLKFRPDHRPTQANVKGSAAWTEVADYQFAPHRPALWKRIDDDVLEVFCFKQRKGPAPWGVAFDWDADTGSISGGRSIAYDTDPADASDVFVEPEGMKKTRGKKKKW